MGQTVIPPYRIISYTEMEVTEVKVSDFSGVSTDTESFSDAEALDTYIQLAPHSVQIYEYTQKYCKEYNVPETIAFGILKLETGYEGPSHFDYNINQTSSGNARGPYQLLVSTAKDMYEVLGLGPRKDVTAKLLLSDVELNVKLGVRYLRWINDNVSSNWKITCGFYNTGYKVVNQYAIIATRYL
jgi:soluble lytic murein transglycosylase-like protein